MLYCAKETITVARNHEERTIPKIWVKSEEVELRESRE
jgi:hypothetical protein